MLAEDKLSVSFAELYSEAIQKDPARKPGGFVRLEFIEHGTEKDWQDVVLERLPEVIKTFQDKGYAASDIGIIVRDGKEGAKVLKTIINYSNSAYVEKRDCIILMLFLMTLFLLSNSHCINFIISVISAVNDTCDMISRAAMLRLFLMARGDTDADEAPIMSNELIERSKLYFPEGYLELLEKIRQMPIFEAVENIIRFFGLGNYSWNVAYLNTFQDYVVSFSGSRNSDFLSFLDWWETTGKRKSVVLPSNQDAMRILTIHKSKGLEFKVVILPFISWNLDHIASKQPVLWVKPSVSPFNELGIFRTDIVKIYPRHSSQDYYKEEKQSFYLDNINLLYVALTRAKDAIYGFSLDNPRLENTIAGTLKNALTSSVDLNAEKGLNLQKHFSTEKSYFEFGEIPENIKELTISSGISSTVYNVSKTVESLKLKLHGENYFSSGDAEIRKR